MNNKVQSFINEVFGEVRTVIINSEIWFVAQDTCKILELSNISKALDTHRNGIDKCIISICDITNSNTTSKARKTQEMLCISEQGLYKLIFKSRKPFAQSFQDWICGTVIPNLRKDGMYINGEEEVESVEELNNLVTEAMERKVLRKYGIGVRNSLTDVIRDKWTISNRFQMATYTNELCYKPLFNKTAKQLKDEFATKKLRDDHFTEEDLVRVADIEKEVALLIDFGQDYYAIKKYIVDKYKKVS